MYKILIIDDEEIIRRGLRVIIERSDIKDVEICEAQDGREGLETIRNRQPDIVITDIRMPYIDGLQLIDQIHQECSKRPVFIIISGYDDFDYAKRAIKYGVKEYLLKPVVKEEFLLLLQNIIRELDDNTQRHEADLVKNIQSKVGVELLKEKYFNTLISGTFYNESLVTQQLLQLGVRLSANQFRILVTEFQPHEKKLLKVLDEMDRFALKEVIDESISGIMEEYWTFYDSAFHLVVLLPNPENFIFEAQVKKVCDQITRTLNAYMCADTFFGVGDNVSGVAKISKSYNDAMNLVLYKMIREPGSVVFSKDQTGDDKYPQNLSIFLKIAGECELGMKQAVSRLLDDYFLNLNLRDGPITKLIRFYDDFNRYMYKYFAEKGIDFSIVFEPGEDDFRDLDAFWSIEQLKEYQKGYLFKISDIIADYKSANPDRKIIEQVIRFIQDNYDQEINLNIVASHFGKNNSYLSVLFKKETGQNFIDYLIMIRIEKAKELLTQNQLKVQEIAVKVGYPNAKHFCMVFKKVTGISPTQYREGSFS